MNRLLTTAMAAIFLMAGVFGQDANNRGREAFMKRLYLSTSDDPMAIVKVKTMSEFELQAPLAKKSKLKASMETGSMVDSTYCFQWDAEAQDWEIIPYTKNIFRYNNNYNLINDIQYNLSSQSNSWINNNNLIIDYNENQNILTTLSQYWLTDITLDSGGYWMNSVKTINTYDVFGRKTNYSVQYWDSQLEQWINNWQHVFQYTTNGLITQIDEEIWDIDNGVWFVSIKNLRENNNYGLLEKNTVQKWNSDLLIWENVDKTIYSYDSNNNNTIQLNQIWYGEEDSIWIDNSIIESGFTSDNKIDSFVLRQWNYTDSFWIEDKKGKYSYDSNGNNTKLDEYKYDISNEFYTNMRQTNSEFDSLNNEVINSILVWNNVINNWGNGKKTVNFRSTYTTTKVDKLFVNYSVFPNPCFDYLTIIGSEKINSIKMSDISGRQIIVKNSIENEKTDLNMYSLSPGYYIIQINFSNSIQTTRKILKK